MRPAGVQQAGDRLGEGLAGCGGPAVGVVKVEAGEERAVERFAGVCGGFAGVCGGSLIQGTGLMSNFKLFTYRLDRTLPEKLMPETSGNRRKDSLARSD